MLGAGDMRYCGSTHEKDLKDSHKRVTRQTERRERGGGGGGGERECIEACVGVSLETNFVNCEFKQRSRAEDTRPIL